MSQQLIVTLPYPEGQAMDLTAVDLQEYLRADGWHGATVVPVIEQPPIETEAEALEYFGLSADGDLSEVMGC